MIESVSETPCDTPSERGGVRSRFAAGIGVGLVGAASLSTAVFQTITQSSTTVGMPGTIAEIDTPLPWGVPVSAPVAPAAVEPTITPTVADLDLRADRQPLAPAAPPVGSVAASSPTPGAIVGAPPEPRSERASTTGGRRPVSSSPGTSGSTRPTTSPGTSSPGTTPSTEPTTGPTTEPSTEPSAEPSTEPTSPPPQDTTEPAAPSSPEPSEPPPAS